MPDEAMRPVEIDLHDTLQPLALLKVNQVLRRMAAGDRLEIRGSDPGTYEALMRLLPEDRFRILAAEHGPAAYRIRLVRNPTAGTMPDAEAAPPVNRSKHHRRTT